MKKSVGKTIRQPLRSARVNTNTYNRLKQQVPSQGTLYNRQRLGESSRSLGQKGMMLNPTKNVSEAQRQRIGNQGPSAQAPKQKESAFQKRVDRISERAQNSVSNLANALQNRVGNVSSAMQRQVEQTSRSLQKLVGKFSSAKLERFPSRGQQPANSPSRAVLGQDPKQKVEFLMQVDDSNIADNFSKNFLKNVTQHSQKQRFSNGNEQTGKQDNEQRLPEITFLNRVKERVQTLLRGSAQDSNTNNRTTSQQVKPAPNKEGGKVAANWPTGPPSASHTTLAQVQPTAAVKTERPPTSLQAIRLQPSVKEAQAPSQARVGGKEASATKQVSPFQKKVDKLVVLTQKKNEQVSSSIQLKVDQVSENIQRNVGQVSDRVQRWIGQLSSAKLLQPNKQESAMKEQVRDVFKQTTVAKGPFHRHSAYEANPGKAESVAAQPNSKVQTKPMAASPKVDAKAGQAIPTVSKNVSVAGSYSLVKESVNQIKHTNKEQVAIAQSPSQKQKKTSQTPKEAMQEKRMKQAAGLPKVQAKQKSQAKVPQLKIR
ncbi:MAG: hypothetical protein RIG62_17955 [Cyclobacteriaceae bacterium]